MAAVAAGGLAQGGGERLDEARGVGPAARGRGAGDGVPGGQQGQGVVQAQLGAPSPEAHAALVAERPGERALAGREALAELGQGGVAGGVLAAGVTVPLATAAGLGWRHALVIWAVPAVVAFVASTSGARRSRAAPAGPG